MILHGRGRGALATQACVGRKRFGVEGFQFGRNFHVAQLAHIKVSTAGAGSPAEEQVITGADCINR